MTFSSLINSAIKDPGFQAVLATGSHLVSKDISIKRYELSASIGAVAGLAHMVFKPLLYVVSQTLRLSDFTIHSFDAVAKTAITAVAYTALKSSGLVNNVGIGLFLVVNAVSIISSASQAAAKAGTGDQAIIVDSTRTWFNIV